MRKHEKHKTQENTNDPQKKYRLRIVSKNILQEGFNRFHGANLTLSSDVDGKSYFMVYYINRQKNALI